MVYEESEEDDRVFPVMRAKVVRVKGCFGKHVRR